MSSFSEMNAAAISLLQQGYHHHSVKTFTDLIHRLKDGTQVVVGADDDTSTQPHRSVRTSAVPVVQSAIDVLSFAKLYEDYPFVAYTKCFLFDDHNEATLDFEILTTVIIYNMAVAQHVLGLSSGLTRPLRKALKIYHLCYHSLRKLMDCEEHTTDDDNTKATLVHMMTATINNMGNISCIFYDYLDISKCQRMLEYTLSHVQEQAMSEEDLHCFRLSILILENYNVLKLAPAA